MIAADVDLDVMISYRARRDDRERWNRAARLAGKTFGAWARAVLSAEATRIEEKIATENGATQCTCGARRHD